MQKNRLGNFPTRFIIEPKIFSLDKKTEDFLIICSKYLYQDLRG